MCTRMDYLFKTLHVILLQQELRMGGGSVWASWATADPMQNGGDRQYCSVSAHDQWQPLRCSIRITSLECDAFLSKHFPLSRCLSLSSDRTSRLGRHTPTIHFTHTQIDTHTHTHSPLYILGCSTRGKTLILPVFHLYFVLLVFSFLLNFLLPKRG